MITSKRTFPIAFIEGGQTEAKISRGMLLTGLVLSVIFNVNVTAAMTSVRAVPLPLRQITIIGDGGRVLKAIRGTDAIREALIYEQTPQANLIVPPSGVAIANYACEAHVPIFFAEPFATDGDLTTLPTWAYDDLTIRVDWGTVTDLFVVGAGAGAITVAAGGATFTQLEPAQIPIANPIALARSLGVSVERFRPSAAAPGVAGDMASITVPVTADIRSLMIVTEDANGEPTSAILTALTLLENQNVRVYSAVPAKTLRADNAKVFGQQLPTGTYLVEFAEDKEIRDIYRASKKDTVDLLLSVAAVAGTVRVHYRTIEPPVRYQSAA